MCPRPMKPHVAPIEAVAEKSLRTAGIVDPPPLPIMQSLDGEKRMETPARMMIVVGCCKMRRSMEREGVTVRTG